MRILVTGGAGFIGSHLVDKLIVDNNVTVVDNLSSGRMENINQHLDKKNFRFLKHDVVTNNIDYCFEKIDEVWHLAAEPDVRTAIKDTKKDIYQNFIATYNILESMKKNNVKRIVYTSSSAIYGEAKTIPTPEDYPTSPISLYGATKLTCEALISAYSHTFDIEGKIFRLANIIGPRSIRGVTYEFVQKLKQNSKELEVLGDGNQKKSYLYIDDCIDGMITGVKNGKERLNVYNIGSEDQLTVKEIAQIVSNKMKVNPKFRFTGGERGWKGDPPLMLLSISKIEALGWKPKHTSKMSVEKTAEQYIANHI